MKIGKTLFSAALFAVIGVTAFAQDDPPARVARLNYTNGNVSQQPAGFDEWGPAALNRPYTTGDSLYTDAGALAELHMDVAVLRMGPTTSFGFLNLNDQVVQLKLTEGEVYIRVRNFGPNQAFEVDTPNAALTLLQNGVYRINVDPTGQTTFAVVRAGQLQTTGGGQAFLLNPNEAAALAGTDQLSYSVLRAPAPDGFDIWCQDRDAHEERLRSAQYLPPTVIGYEDLDDYGDWQPTGNYGPVWYPRAVDAGWAPYHAGHWAWVDPWGWTWVDDAPWGFAPFHYGRWAYIRNRWGWCPGPIATVYHGPVVRPYYAPATVAFFGGAHWGVSVSVAGPSLGWVPLGVGEVYTPPYRCSRPYFNNVNVSNTRIEKEVNITNVYNTVYVNKTVYNREFVNVRAPGAVGAMPQGAFASGRSVRESGFAVDRAEMNRIHEAALVAPGVAPTRQAFIQTGGRPAVRPAQAIVQRQVFARMAPPSTPAPFAARAAYMQGHANEPFDHAAMRAAVGRPVEQQAAFRQAPQANVVQVRPGSRFGNAATAYSPTTGNQVPERASESGQNDPARAPQPSRPAVVQVEPQHRPQQVRPAQNLPVQNTPNPGLAPGLGRVPEPNARPAAQVQDRQPQDAQQPRIEQRRQDEQRSKRVQTSPEAAQVRHEEPPKPQPATMPSPAPVQRDPRPQGPPHPAPEQHAAPASPEHKGAREDHKAHDDRKDKER